MANSKVQRFKWDDMPKEKLNDLIDRRIITGEKVMLTHVYLKRGAVVPMHSHANEQITYILEGKLKFWIESEAANSLTVGPGEVLILPSNLPHKAEALEDTLDVDIFAPPREDWLKKKDDYLRG
jgi:quercetin dioxygenase-like cupin family protein